MSEGGTVRMDAATPSGQSPPRPSLGRGGPSPLGPSPPSVSPPTLSPLFHYVTHQGTPIDTTEEERFWTDMYQPVALEETEEVVANLNFHPFQDHPLYPVNHMRTPSKVFDPSLICESSAMNTFQFMVGGMNDDLVTPRSTHHTAEGKEEHHNNMNTASRLDTSGEKSPLARSVRPENAQMIENLRRSFVLSKSFLMDPNDNRGFAQRSDHKPFNLYEETYQRVNIPYTCSCTVRKDLNFDSLEMADIWAAVKSSYFYKNLITGIRIMLFAVLVPFVLLQSSTTKDWFVAGQLVPSLAASFCFPDFGSQCKNTVTICQCAVYIFLIGILCEVANFPQHPVSWYGAVFSVSFFIGLCGDLPSKRMLMVYGVVMLEAERELNAMGTIGLFSIKFARDFLIAGFFSQLSACLPYPIFSYRLANETMKELHELYAAALGNAVKCYWAPVLLDAEVAGKQIPWTKMREKLKQLQEHMANVAYEPVEFSLKNIFRQERIAHLDKIRWCLYSLSAASVQDNEVRQSSLQDPYGEEVRQTRRKMQELALKLTTEAMRIVVALGCAMCPKEVLKIDFGPLAELDMALQDMINTERDRTLLAQKFSRKETNHLLRLFAFHSSLLKVSNELMRIESWAVNFDRSKYPTFFQRTLNFFIGDYWRDFAVELPKRLTLATPRDVRIVKDAFRYSLSLIVVVVFTHNASVGEHSYYFGMVILARIAQQTASETLQVGIMRICGLAFGASFGYLIASVTHELWSTTVLIMVFGFLSATASSHPLYGHVGQYAVITTIAGFALARQSPETLLNRIAANVFAFTLYLSINLLVFPVDPIRVVRNYRTRVIRTANELSQVLVALGCCPITRTAEEGKYLVSEAEKLLSEQRCNLSQGLLWNTKAAMEPTIRGDPYPDKTYSTLFTRMAELSSLQEGLVESMKTLHRYRVMEPSLLIYTILEMIRPFLIDAAKLVHRYFQHLVDAAEVPFEWSLERTILELWRAKLSVFSLRRVTGNIQQTFISSILPHRVQQSNIAAYVPSAAMESTLLRDSFEDLSATGSFSGLMASFQAVVVKSAVDREDLCVFETIVVNFILLMTTMKNCLDTVIEIHEYDQSRRM